MVIASSSTKQATDPSATRLNACRLSLGQYLSLRLACLSNLDVGVKTGPQKDQEISFGMMALQNRGVGAERGVCAELGINSTLGRSFARRYEMSRGVQYRAYRWTRQNTIARGYCTRQRNPPSYYGWPGLGHTQRVAYHKRGEIFESPRRYRRYRRYGPSQPKMMIFRFLAVSILHVFPAGLRANTVPSHLHDRGYGPMYCNQQGCISSPRHAPIVTVFPQT